MKKSLSVLCLVFSLCFVGYSQVRPVEEPEEPKTEEKEEPKEKIEIKKEIPNNLPSSFKVKYQGGLFGFSKKQHGEIRFDDINERLVFYGKDGKEKFSVPYSAMFVVHPSQKKVQSGTGRVVGAAPIPGSGLLGSLIKKKKNYMIIQFEDPEVGAKGNLNFLLDTEEMTTAAINALGQRAEMKPRGDAYIRSKEF